MTSQARSGAIDAVRVLGILAVIAGHVWESPTVINVTYAWHVPLFFFLTGFFWRQNRSLVAETRNRVRTLLLPYALWLVLIGALVSAYNYVTHDLRASALLDMLLGGNHLGRPFSAFWFVTALFVSAVVLRSLQAFPRWLTWVVASVGLVLSYTHTREIAAIPWSAGVAVPALIFVLAGSAFRSVHDRLTRPLLVGAGMLLVGFASAISGLSAPIGMKEANFGTPVLSLLVALLICSGLVLVAQAAFRNVGTRVHSGATRLASVGFMVVLAHAAVLWTLQTGPNGSIRDFVLAAVLPWAVALLIHRTPLAPYLLGTPRASEPARSTAESNA